MRKLLFLILLLGSLTITAQDTIYTDSARIIQYADTFKLAEQQQFVEDDTWLLELVTRQSEELAARADSLAKAQKAYADSVYQARLLFDTTTIVRIPRDGLLDSVYFHIGLRDSLHIANIIANTEAHPLAAPLYFVASPRKSLADTIAEPMNLFTLRRNVRTYLTGHCADIYIGMYDSLEHEKPHFIEAPHDIVIPVKALVYDPEEERLEKIRAIRNQFSPWHYEALLMLQLTQNYVSKNWYTGGNSNFALLGIAQGTVNYDNRKNFTWENTMEWRMGFNTVDADTLRKVNTNDDIFKFYTKANLRAFGLFSYSLTADFQTHFFHTWKENTTVAKTAPFSPIRLNLAFGLDYKPVNGLSILLSPLAYKFVYANDTKHTNPADFSIAEGNMLNELGSSLRVEWAWNPVREIALDTKFYCYTNYKRVELDLEVACDFIINRYFSARVMLHPRYDNTVILPDNEKAKIQFKELLSIGFAHKFR